MVRNRMSVIVRERLVNMYTKKRMKDIGYSVKISVKRQVESIVLKVLMLYHVNHGD